MGKRFIIITIALFLIAICGFAQGVATIYISRPFKGAGSISKHNIEINNVPIGAISSGGTMAITIPAGDVIIKDYYGVVGNPETLWSAISAEAGNAYYVKINETAKKMVLINDTPDKYKKAALYDFATLERLYNKTQGANQQVAQNNKQQVSAQTSTQPVTNNKSQIISDVDKNIPQSKTVANNTYVLIIANEEYEQLDNVNFAMHDGETFRDYCIKTLGVPEKQVRFFPNATYGKITSGVDWLKYALNNFNGSKGIVYYCGHGIPDEKTGEAFIIPVDGKGTNTTTCYSLNTLYTVLAETKAESITYFMDACFTGANKEGSMLIAARGVAREPAKSTVGGNAIVFSASSGDETAMTYPEKGHGLFTYFLLKKLQETKGNVSYSELSNYINSNVKKEAFLINEKPQTPVVATSPEAQESWRDMKLK